MRVAKLLTSTHADIISKSVANNAVVSTSRTVALKVICVGCYEEKADVYRPVFLNRRPTARYRTLASIIPGR